MSNVSIPAAKVAVHVDFNMSGAALDRVTGQGGWIIGWLEIKHGDNYAVSLYQPKGKTAGFCIPHQRMYEIGQKCPECRE